MPTELSTCCHAPVKHGYSGTSYVFCTKCKEVCRYYFSDQKVKELMPTEPTASLRDKLLACLENGEFVARSVTDLPVNDADLRDQQVAYLIKLVTEERQAARKELRSNLESCFSVASWIHPDSQERVLELIDKLINGEA